jgi:hypothetical protein
MVSVKKGAFIKKVKNITIGSTLSLLLIGGSTAVISCGGGKEEHEEAYAKGVQTYIKEEEKGVFKIIDEKAAEPSETKAFVEYFDGRKDTLNPDQIKGLIKSQVDTTGDWDESPSTTQNDQKSENTTQHYHSYHSGLGWLFWFSAMGHLYGRNNAYTNPSYYSNQDVYNKSKATSSVVRSSRTLRPVSSSRGFFRSWSGSTGG